jgi:hypothetical protein
MRTAQQLGTRVRGPIAFWALAGVALLVSHDAVFLAQLGPGQALAHVLREAGHGYWGAASVALAVLGLIALAATLVRLMALRRSARALEANPVGRAPHYIARWLHAWGRLLTIVAIGFVVQENIEHLIGHAHAPGLGALMGPEYPLALPVIAGITTVAALFAAALSQTEEALLAAIADAMQRCVGRAPRHLQRPPLRLLVSLISLLARSAAGRAPPRLLVSVN